MQTHFGFKPSALEERPRLCSRARNQERKTTPANATVMHRRLYPFQSMEINKIKETSMKVMIIILNIRKPAKTMKIKETKKNQ